MLLLVPKHTHVCHRQNNLLPPFSYLRFFLKIHERIVGTLLDSSRNTKKSIFIQNITCFFFFFSVLLFFLLLPVTNSNWLGRNTNQECTEKFTINGYFLLVLVLLVLLVSYCFVCSCMLSILVGWIWFADLLNPIACYSPVRKTLNQCCSDRKVDMTCLLLLSLSPSLSIPPPPPPPPPVDYRTLKKHFNNILWRKKEKKKKRLKICALVLWLLTWLYCVQIIMFLIFINCCVRYVCYMVYAPPINLSLCQKVTLYFWYRVDILLFTVCPDAGSTAGIVLPIGLFHYSRK